MRGTGGGVRLEVRRLLTRLERGATRWLGQDKTVYVEERVEEYKEFWSGAARGESALSFASWGEGCGR